MRLQPAAALLLAACSGVIDARERDDGPGASMPGAPAPGSSPAPGTAPAPAPGTTPPVNTPPAGPVVIPPAADGEPAEGGPAVRPLRRLTRFEYDNTIRDLLGDASRPASAAFPEDGEGPNGFEVAGGVSPLDATVMQEVAERLATDAVRKSLAKLVPCKLPGDDACAKAFVGAFGRRAFRRPLLPDEQAALEALYANARTQLGYDFAGGVRVVLTAVLQSPEFLYHWELGPQPATVANKVVQLTPWEVGARLSYLLQGTMPDDELLAAAESGALKTADGIAAQARRLLMSPKAREGLGQFFRQWWDLDRIRRTDKGANVIGWDGLRDPMRAETQRFIEAVVFEGDATMKTLLTAPYTFTNNATLAKSYYSVTLPPPPAGMAAPMQKIDLDPAQRAGFLTQGSFLAAQAAPTETSPVKRGNLVLTRLLCIELPPPPADVPPLPASSTALKTMRARAEEHMMNPACSACHKLLDPLGFAFEHYDTVGRYRTMEKTAPIDASGTVTLGGSARPFRSGVELAQLLGSAAEVQDCATRQVMRYALGRAEVADDEAARKELTGALQRGNLRELLVALVSSRTFTQRAPAAGEVLP